MIPLKIKALFEFIDYLDQNKVEFTEKYIPLSLEISDLDKKRSELKPQDNYIEKQLYDRIQKEISEKYKPITQNVYVPILNKLKELNIWSGDEAYASIWNNNISAIFDFKENFESEDILNVIEYKSKYLGFRTETHKGFFGLQFVFNDLDDIFKELFDFFKDSKENEFESFEVKTMKVDNIQDMIKHFMENDGTNIRFSIPVENAFNRYQIKQEQQRPSSLINQIIMGDINDFNKSQIGAVGSHATSRENTFQQTIYSVPENLDYSKLNIELALLKQELAKHANSPEEYRAISEVASAERASNERDGNKVIKSLKAAGKWVFDAANKIGVDVIVELIKKEI